MELMAEGEDAAFGWGTKAGNRLLVFGAGNTYLLPHGPGSMLCQVPTRQTPAHVAAGFRMLVVGFVGTASPGESWDALLEQPSCWASH